MADQIAVAANKAAKQWCVENGTNFRIETVSLYTLYELGSFGKNGEEPEINSAKGFLQRLAQQLEWNRHDRRRAKAYLRSLAKGSGLLDAFVVVPTELLLNSVKNNMEDATGEELEAWKGVLSYVEERMSKGAKFFIIDGQNRLNESIIPFFNSEMPFASDSALVFLGDEGERVNVAGKKFGDLDEGIKEYLREIKIPFVTATAGDIEQFSNALIWKNEGIAWDDWQKKLLEKWYTKFRRQISSIASKDEGDYFSREALSRISGAKFAYDVNGYDLIVAQLLVWMDTHNQPKNVEDFASYFGGVKSISSAQVNALKRYLKEFNAVYDKVQVTNTELRNYVMLRYALDNPKKFRSKLAIPNWNVKKGPNFAKVFSIINKKLMKKPEELGEEASYNIFRMKGGLSSKSKKPGSYLYYNSESKPEFLVNRLVILFNVLTNVHGKTPYDVLDILHKQNTVVAMDTAKMPSLEELYLDNPNDSNGNAIPVSTLKSSNFDRGHKVAKSKGGSNIDLVIQDIRENRQTQEDFVAPN